MTAETSKNRIEMISRIKVLFKAFRKHLCLRSGKVFDGTKQGLFLF